MQPDTKQKTPEESGSKNDKVQNFRAWALAGELGFTIAIPIIALALLGRLADRYFGTAPWLLLAGILISIFISSWLIYRKVREVM